MARMTRYQRGGRDLLSLLDENGLLFPFGFRGELGEAELGSSDWAPRIDIKEKDDRYEVHADIPGVNPKDIDVSMENGVLTIKGSRETEVKEEKENYLRVERSSGSFLRQFSVPEAIDQTAITANCKDGVLSVVLPKAKESLGRKIEVKNG